MIRELGTLTFDFLPFERVQLEEYLNTLYEKGEHFQNTNKGFEIVKTHTRYYYKVTLLSNNEIEEEKTIQSYKQFGYEYIGKFRNFGIFESTENHIISVNEIAEDEIITKLIKKDILLNLFVFIPWLLCVVIAFGYILSDHVFLENFTIFMTFHVVLGIIGLSLFYAYFYVGYLHKRNMNYSYRLCMLRGFLVKYFLVVYIMSDRFLFWSQSLAVGIIIPLVFLMIGLLFYFFYKHNDVAVMYKDLVLMMMFTALIGGMFQLRSVEPIIPQTPFVLEEYNQEKVEQNVFLDYVVQTNDNHQVLETVHMKYNFTRDYIFNKLIDKDEIIGTENRNGYEIKQSKQYTYIMKNKNIIKTNAIDDINEFVNQLNW